MYSLGKRLPNAHDRTEFEVTVLDDLFPSVSTGLSGLDVADYTSPSDHAALFRTHRGCVQPQIPATRELPRLKDRQPACTVDVVMRAWVKSRKMEPEDGRVLVRTPMVEEPQRAGGGCS